MSQAMIDEYCASAASHLTSLLGYTSGIRRGFECLFCLNQVYSSVGQGRVGWAAFSHCLRLNRYPNFESMQKKELREARGFDQIKSASASS